MNIDKIRLYLLCIAWFTAIINVIFGQSAITLAKCRCVEFAAVFWLNIQPSQKESISIIIILLVVAIILLDRFPNFDDFLSAGRFTLVFAALLANHDAGPVCLIKNGPNQKFPVIY